MWRTTPVPIHHLRLLPALNATLSWVAAFCLLLTGPAVLAAPPAPTDGTKGLRIAAVQLEVSPILWQDEASFAGVVAGKVALAVEGRRADVVVFPEYTSIFLALHPYSDAFVGLESLSDGLAAIHHARGWASPGAFALRDLFRREAKRVEEAMDSIWGGLAARFGVYILAGTYFAWDSQSGELRNRLVVYRPDGSRHYTQEKVFLTDFEIDLIKLRPGEIEDARPFFAAGIPLAVTVCRDTFFNSWMDLFEGSAVWIDIKANGVQYTAQEAETFARALPERIEESQIPRGITVCLTGRFLDLLWQGPSSTIVKTENGVRILEEAESYMGEDMLLMVLPAYGREKRETSNPS